MRDRVQQKDPEQKITVDIPPELPNPPVEPPPKSPPPVVFVLPKPELPVEPKPVPQEKIRVSDRFALISKLSRSRPGARSGDKEI
jgi:hypothetical protein